MSVRAFMAKAERSLASAILLLANGDPDGACSRGYYAMFDAARAALQANAETVEAGMSKTHSGVINAFGQYLVNSGKVSVECGKTFNKAHQLRLVADYKGDPVEHDAAARMIEHAKLFVAEIQIVLKSSI